MITRTLEGKIRKLIGKGKLIALYGARQVGKTTLLKKIFGDRDDTLWLNADEERSRIVFDNLSVDSFKVLIGEKKILVIDEAQRINDIGVKLKLIQDNFGKKIQVVASGSSSFDLANDINESLTGRKWTFTMYPLSFKELAASKGVEFEKANLTTRLLYGTYPEIASRPEYAEKIAVELTNDNLYKDVLSLGEVIRTKKLHTLLQALSFQIGSQAKISELSNLVGIDAKTVVRYLDLLEQTFIIFRLPSFRRNLRNELKASQKFYFYDLGIRNGVIDDFRSTNSRPDLGALFENYIIAEFVKTGGHQGYFWRTSQQQEIDYVAKKYEELYPVEIKWSGKRSYNFPKTFLNEYSPKSEFVVNSENYAEMLYQNPPKFLLDK
jgi:predicted AAA+ superfamily ATPase